MLKTVGTALCGMALTLSAASIGFQNPVQWRTVRSADIPVSFLADSTIEGSTITVKIVENDGSVAAQKRITVAEGSNTFTLPVADLITEGSDYYSLQWSVDDLEGVIAPFSVAPVIVGLDPEAIEVPSVSSDITAENVAETELSASLVEGDSEVTFAWNPNALIIMVKAAESVTVSLDPANMKGGFLAYSDRQIVVDGVAGSVEYKFYSRSLNDNAISYSGEEWRGDMTSTVEPGVAVVTIPWYDLGIKTFENRQIGVQVNTPSTSYPEGSSISAPSTWGNILLK